MNEKDSPGKYLIIYNVDFHVDNIGEVKIKPSKEWYHEYKVKYYSVNNDLEFSKINPGSVITNVKKVVILVEGNEIEYLYYERSEDSVIKDSEEFGIRGCKECTTEEDCFNLYGEPPFPYTGYNCIDGICSLK